MKIQCLLQNIPVSLLILRSASLLVPGRGRAEWLAEWKAELWQVCRAHGRGPHNSFHRQKEVTAFCLGAFKDAFWLRRNDARSIHRPVFRIGSAARCGFSLAMLAAASLLICFCLPGARGALLPSVNRDAGDLVMISSHGYSGMQFPTIRLADYQSWKMNTHNIFTELAFYQPTVQQVRIGRGQTAKLSIARASDNLFALLGIPLPEQAAVRPARPYIARLILSRAARHKFFRGDARVVGRVVEIAGQKMLIAGVISKDSWRLPDQMDAWMLENEHGLDALPSNSRGFVLACVKTSGFQPQSDGDRSMTVYRMEGGADHFDCISIAQQSQQPFSIFLFTLFLACLALPATTPLPLGDYPVPGNRLPGLVRARRWVFLLAKFALIVPIVYFCSVALAYSSCSLYSPTSAYIQLAVSFFGFLFAFRWALQDQRKRCPVCLRLLSHPARVGQASRNFLAWNGTELICVRGHGLLHIPEISTSWFSRQRWLYLDPSWRSLFSDAYIAPAQL